MTFSTTFTSFKRPHEVRPREGWASNPTRASGPGAPQEVVARTREVVWADSAREALGEVLDDIAKESSDGAIRGLVRALETAASLSTLAERGRIVPEVGDAALRELYVLAALWSGGAVVEAASRRTPRSGESTSCSSLP